MKKVLKKFNRTLSIMLAAAMVLTMVPQTAMPVLAAEEEQIEAQAETAPEEEVTVPADENDGDEESADVGKADETENSGDSDTTEGETTKEGDETEDDQDTDQPSADDESKDSQDEDQTTEDDQDASDETETGSEEELIEETKPVEDTSDGNKVTDSTINAAEVTEASVTVKTLVDEEEEQENGSTKTVLAGGNESDVDVTFTNGCVNDGKLVKDKNLTFKIEPGAGRVLVKWGYILSDAQSQDPTEATLSKTAVAGQEESVANSILVPKTGSPKSITIFVKTAPAGYRVTFADGEGSALTEGILKIYEVVAEGKEDKLKTATVTTTAGIAIPQGESKDFALELVDESKLLDEDGIKLNGQTVEFDDLAEYAQVGDVAGAAKTKAYPFTVDPSAYGLGSNAEATAAEVQITVRDAYALAVTNLTATNATLKEHSGVDSANEKFVKAAVADGAFTVTDLKEGYEDYEKTKLAFAVLPNENYVIKSVTAKVKNAGDAGEGVEVEVSDPHVIDTGDNEGTHEYTIDLDQDELVLDANKTLTITIETAIDEADENTGVHKITFAAMDDTSDLNNVTITGTPKGESDETIANAAEKTIRTLADDYTVKVEAKDGYALVVGKAGEDGNLKEDEADLDGNPFIVIEETRKYEGEDDTVTVEKKAEVKAAGVKIDFTEQDPGDNKYGTDANAANKKYTVLSAVVKVGVSIQKNDDEKLIAFENKLKDAGAVVAITNASGVYKDQYPASVYTMLKDDTYTVADSVDLLTFTVTSATAKPVVKLGTGLANAIDSATVTLEGVTTEGSNVYTYSVPAKILSEDTIKVNKIVIDKEVGGTQTVKVKVDKVANIARLTSNVESAVSDIVETTKLSADNTEATLTAAPKAGQKIKLVFTAKANVTFGEITCQMGETTVPVTIGTDSVSRQATATIETTVTDAITVDVKTVAPYYVVLSGDGVVEADGVYSADYDVKDIGVELKSAETNVTEAFYDIAVKDGGATAVTTAELIGDKTTAKIAEIKPAEWGKTLTIEVQRTKDKNDKYTATLVVSASSDEVTVTDVATNAAVPESGITVMRDDSFKLRVTPKAGANVNDLKLMLCDATGKKDTKAEALFVGGADLGLDENNEVELKAVAAAAAYDGDVYLGVFNSKNGADGKPQTAPLQGGLVKIKVADPVVLSADIAEVQVTSGDASNKDSNKSIGVNMNVGLASKNAKIKMPLDNNLFYKVEVTGISGSVTEGELKTEADFTDYVQIPRITSDGKYYDASAFAVYEEYRLVKSYKPAGAKTAIESDAGEAFWNLNIPGTISASVKVTLVQGVTQKDLVNESSDAKDYAVGKNGSANFTTKLPIYETKLSITKMNGATVFTGQRAVVAVPKFTTNTSKNDVYAELINAKTGKVIENNYGEWEGISTWVDSAGNVIVEADSDVCPKDLQTSSDATKKDNFKNLAVKITASCPVTADEKNDDMYSGYAATAVLKIKVQQGIYHIDAEQGKAALSETLYQDTRGAVKSVKITPRYNYGYSNEKPAKAKVTWAITGVDGAPISTLDQHMQDAVTGKKPLITVKNGTVSVNKTYKRAATNTNPDADTFYVTATADDFTTGDQRSASQRSHTWTFTISGENQTIGSLVVVDDDNKPLDAAALKAEDFKNGSLYVVAVKTGVEPDKVSGTYDDADYIPVTFKASGKSIKLFGNDATSREIEFLKPGTAKITATTVDGGKGTGTKATLDLTVAAYAQMGLKLTSADGIETGADVTSVSYYGGSNARYTMYLQYYDAAAKTWKNENNYKNVKVAVKGGKFIANKYWSKSTSGNSAYTMGNAVVVTDKKGVATITLTDTATKKTLATYTITNNSNMSVKAPTVKVAKIVDADGNVQKKVDRNSRSLTFQVTTSDKKLENYAGKYIKLTPDFTVDSTKNAAYSWLLNTSNSYGKIEKIDENGQFTRTLGPVRDNCAYKMVATVGDIKDGEFVAAAKDAKVSFNVSNKKYNNNLKIGAKYVLDAQGTPRVPISVTTGYGYYVSGAKNIIKKDTDQTANNHMNNFTTYFQVWDNWDDVNDRYATMWSKDNYFGYEEHSATIGLRTDLTAEQIKYITGQDPATAKAAKADCEGYITVWNGTYSKDVKISVSFNKKGVSFTATADPVYASTKQVEVPVKIMNGKQEVYVDEVVLDGTSAVVESDKNITVEDGVAVIKTVKDLKAGTYDINLRVQPVDSAYNAGTKDKADDKKAIDKVTLTYGVPVTLKLEVKDLADTKMIDVGKNTKYSLKSLAYDGYEDEDKYVTGNGYQIADKKGDPGYYQVDVPYTLAATNAKLANNTNKDTYVKVDLDETLIKPDSKKPALVQAEIVYDNGDKGVLQIRVAKQFIETCDKMDRKDKPLTGWNKKLTVPVSIQPLNQAGDKGAAQTVTFTLTTPKAPATFAQVQEAIKAAGLDKIQTPKSTNAASILSGLWNKVNAKLQTIVAADADVDVVCGAVTGVKPENGPAKTNASEILSEGKAVITVAVTDWSKADSEPVNIDINYNLALDESSGNAMTIASAISNNGVWNFTNDTTEKDLLDEVRKIPAVQRILMKQDEETAEWSNKNRKDNISMKVTSFIKVNATTKTGSMTSNGEGSIRATISIIDLVSGDRATANINSTIKTLTNIVSAYNAVSTALSDDDGKVTEIFQNCAGEKDAIVTELDKVAKQAVKDISVTSSNADVKVEVPADSVVAVKPVKEVAENGIEGQPGYVAPVEAVTGKLSFKVTLTEGTRVKSFTKTITIAATEGDKYVNLTKAAEKVTTAVKGTKADGTTDEAWAKQIDNTLKAAIKAVTTAADFAEKTDTKKKDDIRDAIEKSLKEGVLDGSTVTGIYGYKADVNVSDYKAASREQDEVVTFTVTVKPAVGDDAGSNITVKEAVLSEKADTKMSIAELTTALNGVTTVAVAENAFTSATQTSIADNVKKAVGDYIKSLMPDNQAGELEDVVITVDVDSATFVTVDDTETTGNGTITAIKGVKVTVKKDTTDVIPEKTYTSISITKSGS